MDRNSARALVASMGNAFASGSDQANLGQVLEDSLHPLLKEHIYELHYRHHGQGSSTDFDRDYGLHEEIVRFFNGIPFGGFSLSDLSRFQRLNQRELQGQELKEKRDKEAEQLRLLERIGQYILGVRAFIDADRARVLAHSYDVNAIRVVDEREVTSIVRADDSCAEEAVYQNYFRALQARELLTQQQQVAIEGRQNLERSFSPLGTYESGQLTDFLNDRDAKYSSVTYATKYCQWRLRQLRDGAITIRVVH